MRAFSGFEHSGKGMRDVRCMVSTSVGARDTAARSASSAATAWPLGVSSTQQGAGARCGVCTKSRLTGQGKWVAGCMMRGRRLCCTRALFCPLPGVLATGIKQQHVPAQPAAPAMHHPTNSYPPHSTGQAAIKRGSWQSTAAITPDDNVRALGSLGHRSAEHPPCSTPPASMPEANVPLLSTGKAAIRLEARSSHEHTSSSSRCQHVHGA